MQTDIYALPLNELEKLCFDQSTTSEPAIDYELASQILHSIACNSANS